MRGRGNATPRLLPPRAPRQRSPGPLPFVPAFPEGFRVGEHGARLDSDRVGGATRVKTSA